MPKMKLTGLAILVVFFGLMFCQESSEVEMPIDEIQSQINSVLPYQGKVGTIFTANFWWAHVAFDSEINRIIVTVTGEAEVVHQNTKKNFNWMMGCSADLNYDAQTDSFFLTNLELFDYDFEVDSYLKQPVKGNLFKMFIGLIDELPVYRVNKEKVAYKLN